MTGGAELLQAFKTNTTASKCQIRLID